MWPVFSHHLGWLPVWFSGWEMGHLWQYVSVIIVVFCISDVPPLPLPSFSIPRSPSTAAALVNYPTALKGGLWWAFRTALLLGRYPRPRLVCFCVPGMFLLRSHNSGDQQSLCCWAECALLSSLWALPFHCFEGSEKKRVGVWFPSLTGTVCMHGWDHRLKTAHRGHHKWQNHARRWLHILFAVASCTRVAST